jgi:hypothetical protein
MNTTDVKQKIHDYIDAADARFLRLVHSMIEAEEQAAQLQTDEQQELISRVILSEQDIRSGNTYTIDEVEAKLNKRLSR